MRFLRMLFVVTLAIILIAVALANRQVVTLSAFPAQFGQYLGGTWSVNLPLFLVIFLAILFGMLAGLIWEWLREAHIRREAYFRAGQVARLEREVGSLRTEHSAPRDEILAIVDAPRPAAGAAPGAGAGTATLPAPR